jgi:2-polyprenyl-3-methyl-5-hydroxy-6-metoxy-1,4-benzoquinol methylase
LSGSTGGSRGRRRILAGVLDKRLDGNQAGRTILDVGCGTGEMLDMLAGFGEVKGIDMSAVAVPGQHI